MLLRRFGLTETQATVYAALLSGGEATGYAVAGRTGIARANVYLALGVLVARGLAVASGRRPSVYLARPPREVLGILSEQHHQDLSALAKEFRVGLASPARTAGAELDFEAVTDRDVLVSRARDILATARSEILAVVGPWVPEIGSALADARGATAVWRVVALGTPAPDGATMRPVPVSDLNAYWGGLPVALLADRAQAVCGTVKGGRCSAVVTTSRGLVPFLRHLLRRELMFAMAPRGSRAGRLSPRPP